MPVASPEMYRKMLTAARDGHYAYPAINVTSVTTANAALKGFSDAGSDGIIQLSTGGGEFASGLGVKDAVIGSISIAKHVHLLAERYNIYIALHTDHCQPKKLDTYVRPLIAETVRRRAAGKANLFNSHMFDGSELPTDENLKLSVDLLKVCKENEIILEVEIGVVGGEEDGIDNTDTPAEKLYTTPEDMLAVAEQLGGMDAPFMVAATFGNVHGIYKPGNVVLKPKILAEGQQAVADKYGDDARFFLVFHGGSGSELKDIHETLNYGVIKMNIDTDTQYEFTQPLAEHIISSQSELTHTADAMANKKKFDPRSYLKKAEAGMAERIAKGCKDLKSDGKSIFA